jgi:HlyD family type I secretion membrane fusion protein
VDYTDYEELPDLPDNPRTTILFGMAVVFFFLGGFFVWAVFAPLSEAVVATGVMKVDSSRKQIQHLEGGIVKEILVRDGDRVSQDEILLRLDKTRASASLVILQDGYDAAAAQEARLLAERDGLETIAFPHHLTTRADDPKVSGILQSQRALWDARGGSLEGEIEILQKQIAELQEDIGGFKAQIKAKHRQLSFVNDELDSLRELQKKGLTGKQRLLELERVAAELEGDQAELRSRIGATETEIARKELEIFQVSKNIRQSVVDELKTVQAEIFDLRERLNAAEHVFDQTEVRAPVAGIVVGTGVHTIGGIISPGQTLLELVPINDSLIVEAKIDPQDIDNVRLGLPAGIKLTAFNQRNTPELAGEVVYVSADSLIDERSGTTYFVSRVQVSEDEVKRLQGRELQPGMMTEVFIRTGERTMADYLTKPLRDSFRKAWLEE